MSLTKNQLFIVSKYFNDILDYINIMKTCKKYENLTYDFKYNPIDLPFKILDDENINITLKNKIMNFYFKIFKNVEISASAQPPQGIIHYYSKTNNLPHFRNPFVVWFDFNYTPDIYKMKNEYKLTFELKNCVLTNYYNELNSNDKLIKDYVNTIHVDYNKSKIPSNLDLSDYYKLKDIKEYGFAGCHNLTSITLPNQITYIDELAFYECERLCEVNLKNCTNLYEINDYTFYNCECLKNIDLPISITRIGIGAFNTCNFKEIDLSKYTNLEIIDNEAFFNNCLSKFILPNSPKFKVINDKIISDLSGDLIIPDSITEIVELAFNICSIHKIVFPPLVTKLDCCYDLDIDEVDLTKCINLKEIGNCCFAKCWGLKEIDLSKCINLTKLNDLCFDNYDTTKIILPKGNGKIIYGKNVFDENTIIEYK